LLGAKKIRFGADLKQMIFYATAEDFVGGKSEFTIVALAPFVVINFISLFTAVFIFPQNWIFFLSLLLFHNVMCIGDFSMLSFFERHNDKEVYTFDDLKTMTAWFYEKI